MPPKKVRIVALHGALGLPSDWDPVARYIADEFVAVDLYQSITEGVDSFAEFPEWLENLVPESDGFEDVLVGYSLGGRLALHAMLADPERWQKSVITSSHPGIENPAEQSARCEVDDAWAARFESESETWSEVLQAWNSQPIFAGRGEEWIEQRAALEDRRSIIAKGARIWSLGRQQPLWGEMRNWPHNVLWAAGALDEKFVKISRRASAECPYGMIKVLPDTGHRVPFEAPKEFVEALFSWAVRVSG